MPGIEMRYIALYLRKLDNHSRLRADGVSRVLGLMFAIRTSRCKFSFVFIV